MQHHMHDNGKTIASNSGMMIGTLPNPILDYNKQTAEICRLFSSTLRSLAADATAIRQLSSLSSLMRGDEENHQPNVLHEKFENENKFINNANVEKNSGIDGVDNRSNLAKLRSLDHAVASIEQKVMALRSIISEEKLAIAHFEGSLKEECEAQQLAIKTLLQAYEEVRVNEKEVSILAMKDSKNKPEAFSTVMTIAERTGPSSATFSTHINPIAQETQETNNTIQTKNSQTTRKRRDSIDPRVSNNLQVAKYKSDRNDNRLSFMLVAEKELSRISRNTRGRINLLDLNEALEEIEDVAEKKFDSIPRNSSFSSASRQRRFEYLRQQRGSSYQEIEVEAHQGHYWVSEQELRENCVFFRNGESTARAILSILCSLRRLKQIPGKKRQVTYLCLVQDNETGNDQP